MAAHKEEQVALRELAGVLARATLAPEDKALRVVDLLITSGFTEDSGTDTDLLNAIDPTWRPEPGPGVCRGCGGNFSHALADGKCDECRGKEGGS